MQKYVGGKEIAMLQEPKAQSKLEVAVEEQDIESSEHKTNKKKLEEVAQSIKDIAKEDTISKVKQEFGEYATKDAITSIKNYSEGESQYHENKPTHNYYEAMMGEDKVPLFAQAEDYEQKAEQDAQKSQYLARESLVFGAQLTTNGSPSRDEQTSLSSISARMEQQWIKKNTQPGWWQCLWDLSRYAVISDFT